MRFLILITAIICWGFLSPEQAFCTEDLPGKKNSKGEKTGDDLDKAKQIEVDRLIKLWTAAFQNNKTIKNLRKMRLSQEQDSEYTTKMTNLAKILFKSAPKEYLPSKTCLELRPSWALVNPGLEPDYPRFATDRNMPSYLLPRTANQYFPFHLKSHKELAETVAENRFDTEFAFIAKDLLLAYRQYLFGATTEDKMKGRKLLLEIAGEQAVMEMEKDINKESGNSK